MPSNTGSRRATLSSGSIPMPPQTHNHSSASQSPQPASNYLSVSPLLGERPTSHPQLSSSAPSFSSFLADARHSQDRSSHHSSHNSIRRESTFQSPMLTIEFDGGTHVIVRPNRIVRGKKITKLAKKEKQM